MKALIFDLDGTLLNTIGDLCQSTNYALKKFGYPTRTLEEVNSFVGNGMGLLIQRAVPKGTSEEIIQEVLKEMKVHYAEHYHDFTVPYPGIMELISECKAHRIPMAIVSNKADPFVKKLCDLFFSDMIEVAVGETTDRPRKPAPDMVQYAMKKMNLGEMEAYYVGDSDVDVLTAKNTGLPCLAVTWGFRTEKELRVAGATDFIHDPLELLHRALEES